MIRQHYIYTSGATNIDNVGYFVPQDFLEEFLHYKNIPLTIGHEGKRVGEIVSFAIQDRNLMMFYKFDNEESGQKLIEEGNNGKEWKGFSIAYMFNTDKKPLRESGFELKGGTMTELVKVNHVAMIFEKSPKMTVAKKLKDGAAFLGKAITGRATKLSMNEDEPTEDEKKPEGGEVEGQYVIIDGEQVPHDEFIEVVKTYVEENPNEVHDDNIFEGEDGHILNGKSYADLKEIYSKATDGDGEDEDEEKEGDDKDKPKEGGPIASENSDVYPLGDNTPKNKILSSVKKANYGTTFAERQQLTKSRYGKNKK